MDQQLVEKARALINANLISTTLSTVSRDYDVNIAVLTVLEWWMTRPSSVLDSGLTRPMPT